MKFGINLAAVFLAIIVADPLKAAAVDPVLKRDVDQHRVDLLSPLLIAPHEALAKAHGGDAPVWAADGEYLLKCALWHMSPTPLSWWSGTREIHDRLALAKQAHRVIAAKCDDPHVLTAAAWMLAETADDATPDPDGPLMLLKARVALQAARAHPLIQYMVDEKFLAIWHKLPISDPQVLAVRKEWIGLGIDAAGSKCFDDHTRNLEGLLICDWDNDIPSYRFPRDLVNSLEDSDKVDPWLKLITRARYETAEAWVARGSAWAKDTTASQFEGMKQHLDRAASCLEKAAAMAPKDATAPAEMMSVQYALEDRDAAQKWFQRAIDLQYDNPIAWSAFLEFNTPRWGGEDHLIDVANQVAASERFDTCVPWYGIMALNKFAADIKKSPAVKLPAIYQLAKKICDGYRQTPVPGMPANTLDSTEVTYALITQQWKAANAIFAKAGPNNIDPDVVQASGYDMDVAKLKAAGMSSNQADTLRAGIAANDAGNFDKAISQFSTALSAAPAGDVRRYANLRFQWASFCKVFASGAETSILTHENIDCWHTLRGTLELATDNSIHLNRKSPRLTIAFRPPFTQNYVFRGHLALKAAKPVGIPSIYVLPGVNVHESSISDSILISPILKKVVLHTDSSHDLPIDFGNTVDFAIERVNDRLSVTINGQQLCRDQPAPDSDGKKSVGLDIYDWNNDFPAEVVVSKLTLQKLDEDGKPIKK